MRASVLLDIGGDDANVDLGQATLAENGFSFPLPGTDDGHGANDESISNGSGSHQTTEVGEGLERLDRREGMELVQINASLVRRHPWIK